MNYSISYIIATRNRLPFLKITLERLLREIQPGEEIVVVDGDSSDGSKEYLRQLFEEGKIHQFVSEPDRNQAHAWNKAMLMANGTIIKKIIDDDVFCYEAIRECRDYMLRNPEVDVVISNDLSSALDNHKQVHTHSRLSHFENWSKGTVPSFTFGDVHMLVRKSALAFIGLYNSDFAMMDWEYSLRISYLKANIVYYTGYNAMSVAHPGTTTSKKNERLIRLQGKKGGLMYKYKGDMAGVSLWSKIKIKGGKLIKGRKKSHVLEPVLTEMASAYKFYYDHLNGVNRHNEFQFIGSR